ncbi:MAG: hypothetical protein U0996_25100 [Planctomycetaceae bacterium]
MSEKLPLINRYHAAWIEHGTRVAQRQNAIQIYMASVAALFALSFAGVDRTKEGGNFSGIGHFLFLGTLFLSVAGTILVWMHHRVMQNLCAFMARCERHAAEEIKQLSTSASDDLFYFYQPSTNKLHGFHAGQRLLHRVMLSIIFDVPPFAAAFIVSSHLNMWTIIFGLIALAVVTMIPYMDLYRDTDGA